MTASVSAVAIDSAGRVAAVCQFTRERTIAEMQSWVEDHQAHGHRVAALPFTPEVGVVVAEPEGAVHA